MDNTSPWANVAHITLEDEILHKMKRELNKHKQKQFVKSMADDDTIEVDEKLLDFLEGLLV